MGLLNWLTGSKEQELQKTTELNIEGHKFIAYKDKNNKYYCDLDDDRSPNVFDSEKEAIENVKEVIEASKLMQEAMNIKPGNVHEYMGYEIEIIQNGSTYSAVIEEIGTDYAQKITGRPGEEARTPEDALSMAYSYCSEDYKLQLENGRPNTFDDAVMAAIKNRTGSEMMANFFEWVENKDPRAFLAHQQIKYIFAKTIVEHIYETHCYKEYGRKVTANFSDETGRMELIKFLTTIFKDHGATMNMDEDEENKFCEELARAMYDGLLKDWRKAHPKDTQYKCNDPSWNSNAIKIISLLEKSPAQIREMSEELRKKNYNQSEKNEELPTQIREMNEELRKKNYHQSESIKEMTIIYEPIIFYCPLCQGKIRVAGEHAGKKGKCPKCGDRVQIPAS